MTRRRRIVWSTIAGLALVIAVFAVTQQVAPTPLGYASKTENVGFYPGCGDGPLKQGSLTWYPISRENWATPHTDVSGAAASVTGGRGVAATLPMVSAPPGPGDDVGTLYVYRDGIAYWRSDSGDLDRWFTLVPQVYYGVC